MIAGLKYLFAQSYTCPKKTSQLSLSFLLMMPTVFGAGCYLWVVGMLTYPGLDCPSLFTFISAQLVTVCLLPNSTKSLIVFIFLRVHLPSLSWIGWHRRTYLALLTVNYYILQLKWRDIFIIVSHNGIFLRQTLGTRKDSTCVSILFFFMFCLHKAGTKIRNLVDSINSIMKI